jgi:short-chain Z-isoprenyl diphosphate synthase
MSLRERVKGVLYGLYARRLRSQLRTVEPPRHVGMIVDGNRRWANRQDGVSVAEGHRAGADRMLDFLDWCDEAGVKVVTLYLMSTDNVTNRNVQEITDLTEIIADLAEDLAEVPDWRIHHVGDVTKIPKPLADELTRVSAETADRDGLHINLAVGYGGRHEITEAVRDIIREHEVQGRGIDTLADDITLENIAAHLYTAGQPDLDLVIRTSGEQRISDFMLWQSAHTELYFVEALGPDLREIDVLRALRDFSRRQRRFGS